MTLQETISKLGKMEKKSRAKGYGGDAAECAAKRHTLILLSTRKQKRKPTTYSLKVGQYLKQGKSIQEAHKLARGE